MGRRRKVKNPPLGWRTKEQQKSRNDAEKKPRRETKAEKQTGRQVLKSPSRRRASGSGVNESRQTGRQVLKSPSRRRSEPTLEGMMYNVDKFFEGMEPYQLSEEGRFEEAIEMADEIMAKDGTSTDPLVGKAEALRWLGRLDEALAVSERQMRLRNHTGYQHAEILYEMGRIRELEKFCDHWKGETIPNDPYLKVGRARILFKNGKTDEAVTMLKEVIRDEYFNEYAYVLLIEITASGGDVDEALRLCAAADHEVDSVDLNRIRRMRIEMLLDAGNVDEARDVCSRILANFPDHATFLALMDRINSR